MEEQQAQPLEDMQVQASAEQPAQVPEDNSSNSLRDRKFDMWERKLLDLSLRNNLLNTRKSQMIRLLVNDPAAMEDRLNSEKDYKICPLSDAGLEEKDYGMEDMPVDEEGKIEKEFESDKIYTDMTRGALDDKIKDMFRKGKVAEEENGASSLYLATTFLRWRQKDDKTDLYAPLLLIPCDITRKSIVLGYKVKRRDEDTLLNITIIEKLRQDFGIEIPDFAEGLPQDESGVDVKAVKEAITAAIEGLEGWEVVNTVLLGLFSFSKFVMWNDMHSNREEILNNKIVSSLVENRITWDTSGFEESYDGVDDDKICLPLTADLSQIQAIKAASAEQTFVLHGPPGTGKSQTITSMIADELVKGKKILFVSEKKAALDVVYSRLEKIGLAPFCLELHSNKAKKSHFFEQLRVVSEIKLTGNTADNSEFVEKRDEQKRRSQELGAYVDALHKKTESGFTVYELINIFTEFKKYPDIEKIPEECLSKINSQNIYQLESQLREMSVLASKINKDLLFVGAEDYSQDVKYNLSERISRCFNASKNVRESLEKLSSISQNIEFGIFVENHDKKSLEEYKSLLGNIIECSNLPSYLISDNDYEKVFADISVMCNLYTKAFDSRDNILEKWENGFLDRDPSKLIEEYDEAQGKFGPLRSLAMNSLYKKIKILDKTNGDVRDELRTHFESLAEYKHYCEEANKLYSAYRGRIPEIMSTDQCEDINAQIGIAREKIQKISSVTNSLAMVRLIATDKNSLDAVEGYISNYEEYTLSYSSVNELLKFREGDDYHSLEKSDERMNILSSNENDLRTVILFNNAAFENKINEGTVALSVEETAPNVIDAFREGKIGEDDFVGAFKKMYSKQMAIKSIDEEPLLKNFSEEVFEEKVKQFSEFDEEFFKLTKEHIYIELCKKIPSILEEANKDSILGVVQHAIKSRGRGVSIRSLFSKASKLILDLCPCVLMSPISVAQYLEPGKIAFDTVIFDEASQIPTAEAVGVLARANNAVIVGDPKQMPPTTFFQTLQTADTNSDVDLNDEYSDIEDLESILDDCLAVNIPSMYLSWHYRSRHESLITFSNKSFYDGKLKTFPSADNRDPKVVLDYDPDRLYDRGKKRVNHKEAEDVVKYIYDKFEKRNGKPCSIGVVTFNINQQYEIDDLVSAKCAEDHEFEEWLYGQEEPLFIKNLENVQGDERDVILFSVGYGKDEEGKIYMNFGPLNRDGGWRRLNVAVTRSRTEMKVFSSLRAEDINLTSNSSDGVVAFRRFLGYAAGSQVWDSDLTLGEGNDQNNPLINRNARYNGIAKEIASMLDEQGYICDTEIGASSFKIDIGVALKENPDNYKLGILLDGPSYKEARPVSAREVSQPSLLKGLGWKLIRVRVIEWWESPDKVMEQIIKALNAPAEEPALETPAENATEVAQENDVATAPEAVEVSEAESTVTVDSAEEDATDVPADADATAVAEPAATAVANEPSVWTCECGKEGNTGKFCSECGNPAPVAESPAEPVPVESPEDDVKKN